VSGPHELPQRSRIRFWSPFLSWFDHGPPPQRIQSNPK
jgi:hypothetical protein